PHHLVVLCKNYAGYQNLSKMISRAFTECPPPKKGSIDGMKAVISQKLLDEYGDGLIVLSGCLRGELAFHVLNGDESIAREKLRWFKKRFGPDFFLELQSTGLPEADQVNEILFELGKKE